MNGYGREGNPGIDPGGDRRSKYIGLGCRSKITLQHTVLACINCRAPSDGDMDIFRRGIRQNIEPLSLPDDLGRTAAGELDWFLAGKDQVICSIDWYIV